MTEEETGEPRRRDPRYVEQSQDLSDWIQVKIARQFGTQTEVSGILIDLTPRAVKVGFPLPLEVDRNIFAVGVRLMVTFRFRNLTSLAATATVARVDDIPNGFGLVLFFDFIREADREAIRRICTAFTQGTLNQPPADGAAEPA